MAGTGARTKSMLCAPCSRAFLTALPTCTASSEQARGQPRLRDEEETRAAATRLGRVARCRLVDLVCCVAHRVHF